MDAKFVFVAMGSIAILALGGVFLGMLSSAMEPFSHQISRSLGGWAFWFTVSAVGLTALAILFGRGRR